MTHVGSAMQNRVTLSVATCLLLVGVGVPEVSASNPAGHGSPNLRADRREAHRDAQAAADAVSESSERLQQARARLSVVRRELAVSRQDRRDVDRELRGARERARIVRIQLARAQERQRVARMSASRAVLALDEQADEVVDAVVSAYQGTDPRLLSINAYLTSASLEDVTRQVEASDALIDAQEARYEELRAAEVLSSVRAAQLAAAERSVASRESLATETVSRLEATRQRAREVTRSVRAGVAAARTAQRRAREIRATDLKRLRQVEAREERIREEIRRESRESPSARLGNDGLIHPVAGTVTSPYGYRRHPIYGYWGLHDGIDYGAGCGSPLRAAADGVVTRTYYSDVFGYRLFVNVGRVDGRSLTLIYNHAAGYDVAAGEEVRQGQVVGSVGDTGWSTGCHLHFTVLANGTAVDPSRFF